MIKGLSGKLTFEYKYERRKQGKHADAGGKRIRGERAAM